MSQVSEHVKWCLNKAKREIEEGKKHRGLIKIEPDLIEAKKHILKAEHNLNAIDYFNAGGYSDWSMSAAFYCIYQCFLGIISKFGYESRNQECTISLIKNLKEEGKIDFDEKFIDAIGTLKIEERHESNVIENREFYTYGTTMSVENKEEIKKSIELCKECLEQTRNIIFKE